MDVFLMVRRKKTTVFLDAKETTSVRELKKMIAGITQGRAREPGALQDDQCMDDNKVLTEYGPEQQHGQGPGAGHRGARLPRPRHGKVRTARSDAALEPARAAGRHETARVADPRTNGGLRYTQLRSLPPPLICPKQRSLLTPTPIFFCLSSTTVEAFPRSLGHLPCLFGDSAFAFGSVCVSLSAGLSSIRNRKWWVTTNELL
ncbi:hypothetical protein HPB52_000480 [Rhipicephalus sanguineus]|uniref:Ubiquitin-like domain-containing protein n=1 Tax=Rhipicephalus sanguineus TaxID=34632 RepID=A0A9D4PC12_RHISA|nr:hypothetical protein HPB52_000480 [Rhipicephalus sanguineus]